MISFFSNIKIENKAQIFRKKIKVTLNTALDEMQSTATGQLDKGQVNPLVLRPPVRPWGTRDASRTCGNALVTLRDNSKLQTVFKK